MRFPDRLLLKLAASVKENFPKSLFYIDPSLLFVCFALLILFSTRIRFPIGLNSPSP